ncbi:hypothetical protein J0S82_010730 [Galemys pyrenaicus]|uniref:Uncharacterized protein n=1 Tax=Galemys pyrenaicus TaxID=202257 RepID=A0A8J5ZPW9_GALPY|nr:hypothetical protein J0S82_010730 [Galemys pyrenaicus]
MAAAAGDGVARPLQCAMKLANAAIELDAGSRPRVRHEGGRRLLARGSAATADSARPEPGDPAPPSRRAARSRAPAGCGAGQGGRRRDGGDQIENPARPGRRELASPSPAARPGRGRPCSLRRRAGESECSVGPSVTWGERALRVVNRWPLSCTGRNVG